MSRTVLLTGANSGIGSAATVALLRRGARVVATVRSAEAEEQVRQAAEGFGELVVERLDVTDAERAEEVVDRHRPDVVVNNAGRALLGAVVDVDDADALEQFDSLVIAPVRLARLAARHQQDAGGGTVVNVSSVLAQARIPFTGWYGAAKAALEELSDAMRQELAPAGIHVVRVDCGAVATGAWDEAGPEMLSGDDELTEEGRRRWVELTDLARPAFAEPEEVGEVIAEASLAEDPDAVYRVGFGSRLGVLSQFVPTPIEDCLVRRVFRLRP